MDNIAIGITTYNRPVMLGKCIRAIAKHVAPLVSSVTVHNDGSDSKYRAEYNRAYKRFDRLLIQDSDINEGVAKSKNALLRSMLDLGADWLFLIEDDIIITSPNAVSEYVRIAKEHGISHLSWAGHGPANLQGPVETDGDIAYYFHAIGAWSLYSRRCLEDVGLMDENFHNAWDHVELTLRLAAAGYTTGAYRYADATHANEWLSEVPGSFEKSVIRVRSDWNTGIRDGLVYWKDAKPETYEQLFGPGTPLGAYAQNVIGVTSSPKLTPRRLPVAPPCELVTIDSLTHYYHIYAAPGWETIVSEHCETLAKTNFFDGRLSTIRLGIVGPQPEKVADFCQQWLPAEIITQAEAGWEQLTLTALWEDAQRCAVGDAVLYAHTKGVTEPATYWREEMTQHLVGGWEACLGALETHEVVGCHWMINDEWNIPFFGGNFWWARSAVLQRLPRPQANSRWEAEVWLGRANPAALDVNPTMPRR